jgi:hypothetical protein
MQLLVNINLNHNVWLILWVFMTFILAQVTLTLILEAGLNKGNCCV